MIVERTLGVLVTVNGLNGGEEYMSSEPELFFEEKEENESKIEVERKEGEPTAAFIGASWAALILGVAAYLVGLFNATMELNERSEERRVGKECRSRWWLWLEKKNKNVE